MPREKKVDVHVYLSPELKEKLEKISREDHIDNLNKTINLILWKEVDAREKK